MKPRRAFSLITGVALLGAIAKFNEMPPDARASLLGDVTELARTAVQSLLPRAVATYSKVTRDRVQPPVRVSVAENAALPRVAAQAGPPSGNPLWALRLNQLSTTRERPIFLPSRRPPPTQAFVAPLTVRQTIKPSKSKRPAVTLLGTIVGPGDDRMGIFVVTSTQSILRLRVGQDYHGWVVRLINPREATLVKDGDRTMVLKLPPPSAALPTKRSGRDAALDQVWKVGAD